MVSCYLITTDHGSITLCYNDDGVLYELKADPGYGRDRLINLFTHVPLLISHIDQMRHFAEKQLKGKVAEIPEDLSFARFWDAYDNKVGNKKRVEKKWNALDDKEKAKALAYIKAYNNFLNQNPGVSKCYPETYINQQRWDV